MRSVLLVALFFAGVALSQESEDVLGLIPADLREEVKATLDVAGENRTELERFLRAVREERRRAAAFLVAFMPESMAASVKCDDLLSEFRLAYEAREHFPWGKKIPDEVFMQYVLPNASSQEPFEKFRAYLLPRMKEALAGCRTLEEAALEVNRWCGAHFRFKPTQRRDQGVFENLKRGYGRCEEMSILYIAAARTACIPARHVWTPHWANMDNNHAWVEVWIDGHWKYLGACEPADSLNKAWFTNPAKHAALVLAMAYGKVKTNEEVYRYLPRCTIVNTTRWYSKTCNAHFCLLDREGKAIKDKNIFVCVFNFGALLPIARLKTDEKGHARITLGIGEFFVTSSNDGNFAVKKFKTEPDKKVEVTIRMGRDHLPQGYIWLRYPSKFKRTKGR